MKTIKEISEELGISSHAIRFYEKKGMVDIPRDKNGNRMFDEKSIDRLKAICHYRRVGMSLEDIKAILAEFDNHQLSTELLKKTKIELEKQIAELQETYHYLVEKIEIHQHLAELEKQGIPADQRKEEYYLIRRKLDQ